jgi:hypothetical protein
MDTVIKDMLANLKESCLMMPLCLKKFVNSLELNLRATGNMNGSVRPLCNSLSFHILVNAIFTFEHNAIHVCPGPGSDAELSKSEITLISNIKERLCHLNDNEDDEQTFAKEIDDIRDVFAEAEEA